MGKHNKKMKPVYVTVTYSVSVCVCVAVCVVCGVVMVAGKKNNGLRLKFLWASFAGQRVYCLLLCCCLFIVT